MAVTTYTRAISATENDRVVIPTLARELLDDTTWGSSKLVQVYQEGTDIKVEADPALTGPEQTELDTVVGDHEGYYIKADPEPGGINANSVATPSAPTVTPVGTPGSTTWGYKVTAVTDSGETLASTEQTTTSGPSTLGVSDYIEVSWSKVDGAVGYNVYRTTAGGSPSSTGFIVQVGRETLLIEDKGRSASGAEPTFDSSGIVQDEPGLIGLGSALTADPSAPNQGDFWYNSGDKGIHWYDGSAVRSVDGIWGTEFDQAADEDLDSTTSTTYQQKLRLSVTGLPAGTYRIGWTFGWAGSAANRTFKYRVQVDDTTDVFEQFSEPKDPGSDQNLPSGGFRYIALTSGDHDIDLDYGVVNNGTAYIRNARLEIWRVA